MSCVHCTHCQQAKRDAQDAANAYELGTELLHSELGSVVYWRAALDLTDIHYVYRAGDKDEELLATSGHKLAAI